MDPAISVRENFRGAALSLRMESEMSELTLIGDIGGTNARFAVAEQGSYADLRQVEVHHYATLQEALAEYLAALPAARRPRRAALALAGPIAGDEVSLTNGAWSFSIARMQKAFGLTSLVVLNDFAANALAVPYLQSDDCYAIGPVAGAARGPVGILGPGTGLGVSALVPASGRWDLIPGEGGHVSMPAENETEERIIAILRRRFGHVSAERVLSGAGLVNLYCALSAIEGVAAADYSPADVTAHALNRTDARCVAAFDHFCAMLGTIAGNLALTLGATGGIYLAGGILPRFKEALATSKFRARFEAKGRLADYLRRIPTLLILNEEPALLGLANVPDGR